MRRARSMIALFRPSRDTEAMENFENDFFNNN